jgi:hypothetical protein
MNICTPAWHHRAMSIENERDGSPLTLLQALGMKQPRRGWWRWLRDSHFVLAILAAVPAWIALGQLTAHRIHVDFAPWPLISLLVVRPVIEELAFRCALQSYLSEHGGSRSCGPLSIANLITTAAFVALHFAAQPPAWALAVAVPSLLFGHLRERFDSVLPPVVLHAFYNSGFAVTAWMVRS